MLTNEQQQVFNACKNDPAPITIIQGKAGSGKSYLVKELVKNLSDVVILTPTNMASSVYSNAQTLHSFFYGEFDDLDERYQNVPEYRFKNNPWCYDRIINTDVIIFDEISMVRSDYFEMMNVICQAVKRNKKPFGGIQIILVGDMYQLPPVVEDEQIERYLYNEYGGIYFFNSHVIQNNIESIRYYELNQSKRQENDSEFVKVLDVIRKGSDLSRIVESLDLINSRIVSRSSIPDNVTTIASSNAEVMRINQYALQNCLRDRGIYRQLAQITIKSKNSDDYKTFVYGSDLLDDENYEIVEIPSSYEAELLFKIGSKVMFTSSNKKVGYVNGDTGIVDRMEGDAIIVKKEGTNDSIRIVKTVHYRYRMYYDAKRHKLQRVTPYLQKTTQYPLKQAYAFTIHKSQGQTYKEGVFLDLESPVFASGQLYVALSRAVSLAGLYLTKPVSVSDVIVDPSIAEFFGRFNSSYISQTYQVPNDMSTSCLIELSSTINTNEQDELIKKVVTGVVKTADALCRIQKFGYALLEMNKISNILLAYYQLPQEYALALRRVLNHRQLTKDLSMLERYCGYIKKIFKEIIPVVQKKPLILDKLH